MQIMYKCFIYSDIDRTSLESTYNKIDVNFIDYKKISFKMLLMWFFTRSFWIIGEHLPSPDPGLGTTETAFAIDWRLERYQNGTKRPYLLWKFYNPVQLIHSGHFLLAVAGFFTIQFCFFMSHDLGNWDFHFMDLSKGLC